jgi:hypothetical protein
MSRVNSLVKARSNVSVKFLEFTRIASKGIDKYAIFFEGEDEKYYSVRINSIRPDISWSGINSGGKSNVISLREKIRSHSTYCVSLCLFFVDADFDDNSSIMKHDDFYITPCYSVENLFITNSAFKRILNAEFGVSDSHESNQCFVKSVETFERTKSCYLEAIEPFNTLIRELRFMEERGDIPFKLNISNINFDSLISITLEGAQKCYDEKNPRTLFPDLQDDINISLNNSKQYFTSYSGELWFRGKQNLEFFRIFLSKLKEDRCKKENRIVFKDKGNVKLNMSKANCISELSQYADTPVCLRTFLDKQNPQGVAV